MSLFASPVVRATDANNLALSGARWHFYEAGGLTPATVYTTAARNVAHANPVVSDSGGQFASIYLDPIVSYRAVLKTAGGSTIADIDPISVTLTASDIAVSTGGTVADRLSNLPINIKDAPYSAAGDGTTNDTSAFTEALTSGSDVYVPAGTFLIDPVALSGLDSLRIRGAGRDVTKIKLISTGTALTFSDCQWLQMSDFTLEATGTPQTLASSIGIQLDTGSSNALIQNFILRGFSLDGIRQVGTALSPLSGNTLRDGYVLGCGRNQIYGYYNSDFTIDNVQTGKLDGITHAAFGMLLENCGEGGIINTKTWENTRGYKALNCTGLRHDAIRVEQSDLENVWIEGCTDIKFDGACRFFAASQTTNGASDNFYAKTSSRLILQGDANTWDATYSKWAVNIDTGCDDVTLKCHQIGGFDATNAGPIRVASGILRTASDIATQLNGASVAAGTTVYLSGNGSSSAEGAGGRQCHTQLAPIALIVACVTAPGASKNYTYTLRKNGVDTSVTVQINGTATSARINTVAPGLIYDIGDWYSLKLVTDAASTVTDHRATLVMAEY